MNSLKGCIVSELVSKLMEFGFTKTDALVYINLLKNGRGSGYRIAKDIALSRSSVYSSIDTLYKKGFIFMSDGNTKEYEAKTPELILNQIKKKTAENIHILKKELSQITGKEQKEFVYNIKGFDNLIQKTRELIHQAQHEIYLNTDINLTILEQEISEAIERGVRIIAFSFNRIALPHEKIELYARSDKQETEYPSHRFMLVADMKLAIMFSHRNETVGLYSNNFLVVKMIAEHIHSDIYLSQYESLAPEKRFRINSLHERCNSMVNDQLTKQLSECVKNQQYANKKQ